MRCDWWIDALKEGVGVANTPQPDIDGVVARALARRRRKLALNLLMAVVLLALALVACLGLWGLGRIAN
jgi:uncharacterized protein involved in cysteine biosynthesis